MDRLHLQIFVASEDPDEQFTLEELLGPSEDNHLLDISDVNDDDD